MAQTAAQLANLNRNGRPKGARNKPKPARERVAAAAARKCAAAVRTLAEVMQDPDASPADRIRAANSILDRGIGKPPRHGEAHRPGGDPAKKARRVLGLADPPA